MMKRENRRDFNVFTTERKPIELTDIQHIRRPFHGIATKTTPLKPVAAIWQIVSNSNGYLRSHSGPISPSIAATAAAEHTTERLTSSRKVFSTTAREELVVDVNSGGSSALQGDSRPVIRSGSPPIEPMLNPRRKVAGVSSTSAMIFPHSSREQRRMKGPSKRTPATVEQQLRRQHAPRKSSEVLPTKTVIQPKRDTGNNNSHSRTKTNDSGIILTSSWREAAGRNDPAGRRTSSKSRDKEKSSGPQSLKRPTKNVSITPTTYRDATLKARQQKQEKNPTSLRFSKEKIPYSSSCSSNTSTSSITESSEVDEIDTNALTMRVSNEGKRKPSTGKSAARDRIENDVDIVPPSAYRDLPKPLRDQRQAEHMRRLRGKDAERLWRINMRTLPPQSVTQPLLNNSKNKLNNNSNKTSVDMLRIPTDDTPSECKISLEIRNDMATPEERTSLLSISTEDASVFAPIESDSEYIEVAGVGGEPSCAPILTSDNSVDFKQILVDDIKENVDDVTLIVPKISQSLSQEPIRDQSNGILPSSNNSNVDLHVAELKASVLVKASSLLERMQRLPAKVSVPRNMIRENQNDFTNDSLEQNSNSVSPVEAESLPGVVCLRDVASGVGDLNLNASADVSDADDYNENDVSDETKFDTAIGDDNEGSSASSMPSETFSEEKHDDLYDFGFRSLSSVSHHSSDKDVINNITSNPTEMKNAPTDVLPTPVSSLNEVMKNPMPPRRAVKRRAFSIPDDDDGPGVLGLFARDVSSKRVRWFTDVSESHVPVCEKENEMYVLDFEDDDDDDDGQFETSISASSDSDMNESHSSIVTSCSSLQHQRCNNDSYTYTRERSSCSSADSKSIVDGRNYSVELTTTKSETTSLASLQYSPIDRRSVFSHSTLSSPSEERTDVPISIRNSSSSPMIGPRKSKEQYTQESVYFEDNTYQDIKRAAVNAATATSNFPDPPSTQFRSGDRLSPDALSSKLLAEVNLLAAIGDSETQLERMQTGRFTAIAQQETVAVAQILQAERLQGARQIEMMASEVEHHRRTAKEAESNVISAAVAAVTASLPLALSPRRKKHHQHEVTVDPPGTTTAQSPPGFSDSLNSIVSSNADIVVEETTLTSIHSLTAEDMSSSTISDSDEPMRSDTDTSELSSLVLVQQYQPRNPHHGDQSESSISENDGSVLSCSTSSFKDEICDVSLDTSGSGSDGVLRKTAQLVHKELQHEERRRKQQHELLRMREKALEDKAAVDLAWLEDKKKRLKQRHGKDDRMPGTDYRRRTTANRALDLKERQIVMQLASERAEIDRVKAAHHAASVQHQLLLHEQQQAVFLLRAKTRRIRRRCREDKKESLASPVKLPIKMAVADDVRSEEIMSDISSSSELRTSSVSQMTASCDLVEHSTSGKSESPSFSASTSSDMARRLNHLAAETDLINLKKRDQRKDEQLELAQRALTMQKEMLSISKSVAAKKSKIDILQDRSEHLRALSKNTLSHTIAHNSVLMTHSESEDMNEVSSVVSRSISSSSIHDETVLTSSSAFNSSSRSVSSKEVSSMKEIDSSSQISSHLDDHSQPHVETSDSISEVASDDVSERSSDGSSIAECVYTPKSSDNLLIKSLDGTNVTQSLSDESTSYAPISNQKLTLSATTEAHSVNSNLSFSDTSSDLTDMQRRIIELREDLRVKKELARRLHKQKRSMQHSKCAREEQDLLRAIGAVEHVIESTKQDINRAESASVKSSKSPSNVKYGESSESTSVTRGTDQSSSHRGSGIVLLTTVSETSPSDTIATNVSYDSCEFDNTVLTAEISTHDEVSTVPSSSTALIHTSTKQIYTNDFENSDQTSLFSSAFSESSFSSTTSGSITTILSKALSDDETETLKSKQSGVSRSISETVTLLSKSFSAEEVGDKSELLSISEQSIHTSLTSEHSTILSKSASVDVNKSELSVSDLLSSSEPSTISSNFVSVDETEKSMLPLSEQSLHSKSISEQATILSTAICNEESKKLESSLLEQSDHSKSINTSASTNFDVSKDESDIYYMKTNTSSLELEGRSTNAEDISSSESITEVVSEGRDKLSDSMKHETSIIEPDVRSSPLSSPESFISSKSSQSMSATSKFADESCVDTITTKLLNDLVSDTYSVVDNVIHTRRSPMETLQEVQMLEHENLADNITDVLMRELLIDIIKDNADLPHTMNTVSGTERIDNDNLELLSHADSMSPVLLSEAVNQKLEALMSSGFSHESRNVYREEYEEGNECSLSVDLNSLEYTTTTHIDSSETYTRALLDEFINKFLYTYTAPSPDGIDERIYKPRKIGELAVSLETFNHIEKLNVQAQTGMGNAKPMSAQYEYNRSVFDSFNEIMDEIVPPAPIPVPRRPWMRPDRNFRRFRKPPSPNALGDIVWNHFKRCLVSHTSSDDPNPLDTLLKQEVAEAEPSWVDYDLEELEIKNIVAESLFRELLVDTVNELNNVYRKRAIATSRNETLNLMLY